MFDSTTEVTVGGCFFILQQINAIRVTFLGQLKVSKLVSEPKDTGKVGLLKTYGPWKMRS